MKPMIISEKNKDRINDTINEVEGKAVARTVTYHQIVNATATIEKTLNIPKKYLEGVEYDIDIYAQHFPHAYKYTPISTHVTVVFGKGKWRITTIYRDRTRTSDRFRAKTMPQATKDAIIEARCGF